MQVVTSFLTQLDAQAQLTDLADTEIVRILLKNVRNADHRMAVKLAMRSQTLQEFERALLERARLIDSCAAVANSDKGGPPNPTPSQGKQTPAGGASATGCSYCGKLGHTEDVCRSKLNGRSKSSAPAPPPPPPSGGRGHNTPEALAKRQADTICHACGNKGHYATSKDGTATCPNMGKPGVLDAAAIKAGQFHAAYKPVSRSQASTIKRVFGITVPCKPKAEAATTPVVAAISAGPQRIFPAVPGKDTAPMFTAPVSYVLPLSNGDSLAGEMTTHLDSCSEAALISADFVATLEKVGYPLDVRPLGPDDAAMSATATPLAVKGTLQVEVNGGSRVFTFLVANMPALEADGRTWELLIGSTILSTTGLSSYSLDALTRDQLIANNIARAQVYWDARAADDAISAASHAADKAAAAARSRPSTVAIDAHAPNGEPYVWDHAGDFDPSALTADGSTDFGMPSARDFSNDYLLVNIGNASPDMVRRNQELCHEYRDVFGGFSETPNNCPPIHLQMKPDAPPQILPYRTNMNPEAWKAMADMADEYIRLGIFVPYEGPHGERYIAPCRPKEEAPDPVTGKSTWRGCIDASRINEHLVRIPWNGDISVERTVRDLANLKAKCVIDFAKQFPQFAVHPNSWYIQGVRWPTQTYGVYTDYSITRLSQGSCNSPSLANNYFTTLFMEIREKPYVDDFAFGNDIDAQDPHESCFNKTRRIFQMARETRTPISAKKSYLNQTSIKVVGRITDGQTISLPDDERLDPTNWERPTSIKQLRSLIGWLNWYRDSIPRLSTELAPLSDLTSDSPNVSKRGVITWTPDLNTAYGKVQQLVRDIEPLNHIDPNIPLSLYTDASLRGIGAVLVQTVNGVNKVIAHFSKKFSSVQSRWPTIEQEASAIYFSIMHFRAYLITAPFVVHTDHRNLTFILKCESRKVLRWRMELQEFTFTVVHVPGEDNPADYPSRL